jgi:hypothetical protein
VSVHQSHHAHEYLEGGKGIMSTTCTGKVI